MEPVWGLGDDPFAPYRALLDGSRDQQPETLAGRRLLHAIATPVFIKDANSRYVACNRAFAAYAGMTPEEVVGLTDRDMPWGPSVGADYVDWDRHVIETGNSVSAIEEPTVKSDGSTRWLETNKVPFEGPDGTPIGVIGSFHDITDHRELRESMLEMAAAVATTKDTDSLLDEVIVSVRQAITVDMVAVLLVDEGGEFGLCRIDTRPGYEVTPDSAADVDFTWLQALLVPGAQNGTTTSAGSEHRLGPAEATLASVMVVAEQPVGILLVEGEARHLLTPTSTDRLGEIAGQTAATLSALDRSNDAGRTGASAERDRLAQELHDSVLQTLWSVSLLADAGLRRVKPDDPNYHLLEQIQSAASASQLATRSLVLDRSPSELSRLSLRALIENAVAMISLQTPATVTAKLDDVDVSPNQRLAFYRIAQEALSNVFRHSNADSVTVSLSAEPAVTLTISDDGDGFDSTAVPPGHLGLGIMSARAAKADATMSIISKPGDGTVVTASTGRSPSHRPAPADHGRVRRSAIRHARRRKTSAWSLPVWCLASLIAVISVGAIWTVRNNAVDGAAAATELVDRTTLLDTRVTIVRAQIDELILLLARPHGVDVNSDLAAAQIANNERLIAGRERLEAATLADNGSANEARRLLEILDQAESDLVEPRSADVLYEFAEQFQFDGVPLTGSPPEPFDSLSLSVWLDQPASFIVYESLIARFSTRPSTFANTSDAGRHLAEGSSFVESMGGWLGPVESRPLNNGYIDIDVATEHEVDTVSRLNDALTESALWTEDQWIRGWATGPLGPPPTTTSEIVRDGRRTVTAMRAIVDERFDAFVADAEAAETNSSRTVWLLSVAMIAMTILALGAIGRTIQLFARRLRALQLAAKSDPLTGLGNRKILDVERAHLSGSSFGEHHVVVSIDMDRFKIVNDIHGHAFGDRLLRVVADGLRAIEAKATVETTSAIRLGGDEFLLVLHDAEPIDAEALRDELDTLRTSLVSTSEGELVQPAFSYGLAQSSGGRGLDDLMHEADLAAYEEKSKRRHTPRIHQTGELTS